MTSEEALELLSDTKWRLNHLYRITDTKGQDIPFVMNSAQTEFFDNMHYFNVILKARQLGFSTFTALYLLDACLFTDNHSAGIIAQGLNEAEDMFRNKVKYAYDRLPEWLKENRKATMNSSRRLEFSNGSSIQVGTSLRGGTMQKLHISEYGKIAARYPDKAAEIKTGALNTVHAGQQIFVESTAEGQQGEFFELVERARKMRERGVPLTPLDPKLHFFPWYDNPNYVLADVENAIITQQMADYFNKLPVKLTPEQKAWYVKKAESMGEYMMREYPSTPVEAFQQSMEGAIYEKQMTLVRANKQIGHFPYNPSKRVYTFWDLGRGRDLTSIWFFQYINHRRVFIDYHESHNEGWDFYAKMLNSKPYVYAEHLLPHDGTTSTAGREMSNPKRDLEDLGVMPIRIVPRTPDLWSDIKGQCRTFLVQCSFDEEKCAVGINHLDNYRREWDDRLACWKDKPRHDGASHGADAFRTGAMGFLEQAETNDYFADAPKFAEGYNALDY